MAELRHYPLTTLSVGVTLVAALASLGGSCASKAEQLPGEPRVVVTNLATPGGVSIANTSKQDVQLARDLVVERQAAGKWERVEVALALSSTCEKPSTETCPTLAAGATLRPVRWNGFTCAPQCPGSCRANVYLGPGTFRFVVSTCDRAQRFVGPAFELPAERK
jgi:hypothetical protein